MVTTTADYTASTVITANDNSDTNKCRIIEHIYTACGHGQPMSPPSFMRRSPENTGR